MTLVVLISALTRGPVLGSASDRDGRITIPPDRLCSARPPRCFARGKRHDLLGDVRLASANAAWIQM